MAATIEHPHDGGLTALLRRELRLTDVRVRTMVRIVVCTTAVVTLTMVFKIPLPAYVAYLVFLVSQEDAASTLVSAVGGLVAVTIAIAVSLLFYVFDAAEPALRLPLLAASTMAGTYLARTSRLGPIIFLAGFILVLSQTLLDDVPTPEVVTHAVLWLWVVVALPVGVTVLANLLAGDSPVMLARKRAAQLMSDVARYIEEPQSNDPSRLRNALLGLIQLKNKAIRWDKAIRIFARQDDRMIAALLEVLQLAQGLSKNTSGAARRFLAEGVRWALRLFLSHRGMASGASDEARPSAPVMPDVSVVALEDAISNLIREATGPTSAPAAAAPDHADEAHRAVAASTRPHARFAFKVMCAVLASYAMYTLLDWPGIRTAVTTCFFVSLTTVGESVHKLLLRLTGAIIGGLIAGLCIVFVLPLLTDIGELSLLIAVVSAFCAWISTSSENIAYAGMQIAFAFFLGVLQGYGPADDLTVLRDRVVGIIAGNLWITLFFTVLWPVSVWDQVRATQASVLGKLGDLLVTSDRRTVAELKIQVFKELSQASSLRARALFEWRFLPEARQSGAPHAEAIDLEEVTSAILAVTRLRESINPSAEDMEADQRTASRVKAISNGGRLEALDGHTSAASPEPLGEARRRLDEVIDHAFRRI